MLGDSPYALAASLQAHLVAAAVYEQQGEGSKQDEHCEMAGRYAAALKPYQDRPLAQYRGWYLNYVGRDDAELEQWRVLAESNPGSINYFLISALYRQAEFAEALQACDRAGEAAKGTWLEISRIYVLAEHDGPETARKALEELLRQTDNVHFYSAVLFASIARLLGDNSQAEQLSRPLKDLVRMPPGNNEFKEACLSFNCGDITDEQFLAAARGSRWNRCDASFHIALKQLAQGHRAAAQSYFRQAIETRSFPFFSYRWSQAFLHRMEQDPQWPPWI